MLLGPWKKPKPKAQQLGESAARHAFVEDLGAAGRMIPTPAVLLRMLTWLAFPDAFESQVPDPEVRAQLRTLADEAQHAADTTQALRLLANALKARLCIEDLRKIAGGL